MKFTSIVAVFIGDDILTPLFRCHNVLKICLLSNVHTYLQLHDANSEVGFVELIRNIPTKWSKFPPFLGHSVKEAKSEQKTSPFERLLAAIEEMSIRYRVVHIGTKEIISQPFRCFVRHFDT